MIDYKNFQTVSDLQEQIEREERSLRNIGRVLMAGAAAVALTGLLMFQCTEAVIKTAENQERYYSAPVLTAEQEEYRSFSCGMAAHNQRRWRWRCQKPAGRP